MKKSLNCGAKRGKKRPICSICGEEIKKSQSVANVYIGRDKERLSDFILVHLECGCKVSPHVESSDASLSASLKEAYNKLRDISEFLKYG